MDVNNFASVMELLTPDESARKIIDIINRLEQGDSGRFMDYNGINVPL